MAAHFYIIEIEVTMHDDVLVIGGGLSGLAADAVHKKTKIITGRTSK